MNRKTESRGEVISIYEPPFILDKSSGRVVGEVADIIEAITHKTARYIGGNVVCLFNGTNHASYAIIAVRPNDLLAATIDKAVALQPETCPQNPRQRCSECPLGS